MTATTIMTVLPVFMVGAFATPLQASLSFGNTGLGLVTSSYLTIMGITASVGGRAVERFGARRSLVVAMLLCGAGCVIAAASQDIGQFVVGICMSGAATAIAQSGASALLSSAVAGGRQGLAFGWFQASKPAAALLAGAAAATLIGSAGWRPGFATIGLGAFLMLIGIVRVTHGVPSIEADRHRDTRPRSERSHVIATLAVAYALSLAVANSLSAFLVPSSVAGGLAVERAALVLSFGGALAIIGRLVSGALNDRFARDPAVVAALMLAVGGAGLGVIGASGGTVSLLFGVTLACGVGWGFPGLVLLAVVRNARDAPARATGVVIASGALGGAFGPATFGFITTHNSFAVAWWACGAVSVLASVALLVSRLQTSPCPA